ncbi:MAG: hypothetical protein Q8K32_22600 [Archangium sp.]|nr:hypothetical protein [Archangium sp.]
MKSWWPLALGVCLSSCLLDNSLGGSLSEVFPLDLSTVEVAQNPEALQITYFRNRGVFLDVVVRVSVSLQDEGVAPDGGVPTIVLAPGKRLELQGESPAGQLRCAVSHAPGGEPVRSLPRIKNGDIVITEGGNIGEPIKGNFSMLFEQEGGDVGFGRTLFGRFSSKESLDAGFGDP